MHKDSTSSSNTTPFEDRREKIQKMLENHLNPPDNS